MYLDRKTVVNTLLFSGNTSVGAGVHVTSPYLCSGEEHKGIRFFIVKLAVRKLTVSEFWKARHSS